MLYWKQPQPHCYFFLFTQIQLYWRLEALGLWELGWQFWEITNAYVLWWLLRADKELVIFVSYCWVYTMHIPKHCTLKSPLKQITMRFAAIWPNECLAHSNRLPVVLLLVPFYHSHLKTSRVSPCTSLSAVFIFWNFLSVFLKHSTKWRFGVPACCHGYLLLTINVKQHVDSGKRNKLEVSFSIWVLVNLTGKLFSISFNFAFVKQVCIFLFWLTKTLLYFFLSFYVTRQRDIEKVKGNREERKRYTWSPALPLMKLPPGSWGEGAGA